MYASLSYDQIMMHKENTESSKESIICWGTVKWSSNFLTLGFV